MIRTVFRAEWKHLREAGLWLAFHFVGALMPVWVGLLILMFLVQPVSLGDFLDKGEFAIYGAALIAPVMHALLKEHPGDEKTLYFLIALVCLIIATIIFLITVFPSLEPDIIPDDRTYLRVGSIVIYGISLGAALLLRVYENIYSDFDVNEERQAAQQTLDAQFDDEMEAL